MSAILNGARIQVAVGDNVVGWLDNVTWQLTNDIGVAFVLGRTGPAEIQYTGQEAITGSLGGWRVVDHGVYSELGLPLLGELLTSPYTSLTLFDRVTNKRVAKISQMLLGGFSGGTQARQMEQQSVPFTAIKFDDETGTNSEAQGATSLPA